MSEEACNAHTNYLIMVPCSRRSLRTIIYSELICRFQNYSNLDHYSSRMAIRASSGVDVCIRSITVICGGGQYCAASTFVLHPFYFAVHFRYFCLFRRLCHIGLFGFPCDLALLPTDPAVDWFLTGLGKKGQLGRRLGLLHKRGLLHKWGLVNSLQP